MLLCALNSTHVEFMAKINSPTKPRLVVYLSSAELKATKSIARVNGCRTPHQWLGVLMRREIAKGTK